jgi:hypothetical protein
VKEIFIDIKFYYTFYYTTEASESHWGSENFQALYSNDGVLFSMIAVGVSWLWTFQCEFAVL